MGETILYNWSTLLLKRLLCFVLIRYYCQYPSKPMLCVLETANSIQHFLVAPISHLVLMKTFCNYSMMARMIVMCPVLSKLKRLIGIVCWPLRYILVKGMTFLQYWSEKNKHDKPCMKIS